MEEEEPREPLLPLLTVEEWYPAITVNVSNVSNVAHRAGLGFEVSLMLLTLSRRGTDCSSFINEQLMTDDAQRGT